MLKSLLFIFTFTTIVFANNNLEELMQKAKGGDVQAIYQLGYIYENGIGVKADTQKAFKLYQKASQMGSSDAKLSLELMNLDKDIGKGSISQENRVIINSAGEQISTALSGRDLKEIVQAAKSGDKEALYTLGVMYENGFAPIKQNKQKAVMFYKKAAKAGSRKALKLLEFKKILESN